MLQNKTGTMQQMVGEGNLDGAYTEMKNPIDLLGCRFSQHHQKLSLVLRRLSEDGP